MEKKKGGSHHRRRGRRPMAGKSLLIELKPQFLQQLFVAFQFREKSSAKVSVAGLEYPYAVFRCAVGHPFFDEEVTYAMSGKEVPDDHFSLYLAVSIAFLRKG